VNVATVPEDTAKPVEAARISDAVLLTSAQVSKWVFRLIFALLAARSLGPDKFGVYALLFTVTEFLAVASGSGYADYLTRETAKDERVGWGLASQLTALRIVLAIPIAALEIALLGILKYSHITLIAAAAMALTIVPRSVSEAVQGALRGDRKYRAYLWIEMLLGGSLVAGGALLILRRGGLGMVIETELIAAAAGALGALIFALRFRTNTRFHLSIRRLVRTSAIFNAYSFIGTLYDRFDVVLLSKLAGDYSTAIYSVAYRVVSAAQILAYGVLYSLLPVLSRDQANASERRRLERAMGLLVSAGYVVVLATIIFAEPAVQLLLGARYRETASALRILVWAVIPRYLNYTLNIALLAGGRERVFVGTSLTCLLVNLAGNLLLIPRYGWRAAAFLTTLTELVLLAQNIYWARRMTRAVPIPPGLARTSLAFGAALAGLLLGRQIGLFLPAGIVCLLCFVAYLYFSQASGDIAAVWDPERGASV
jgi:O-antigen/teichoic acid export membrane protein